jgi:hypothetical protein
MAAVLASDSDAPFDTDDPLFRHGHGLRYVKVASDPDDGPNGL